MALRRQQAQEEAEAKELGLELLQENSEQHLEGRDDDGEEEGGGGGGGGTGGRGGSNQSSGSSSRSSRKHRHESNRGNKDGGSGLDEKGEFLVRARLRQYLLASITYTYQFGP